MQIDVTTLHDLSIFSNTNEESVFSMIDKTSTQVGSLELKKLFLVPPKNIEELIELQSVVKFWSVHTNLWTNTILNGTIVMLQKYFESADLTSLPPTEISLKISSFFQKIVNKQEYSLTLFSLSHLSDFFIGCKQIVAIADKYEVPSLLEREIGLMKSSLEHQLIAPLTLVNKNTPFSKLLHLNYRARRELKLLTLRLMNSFAKLDAWHGMAVATATLQWDFPEIIKSDFPVFETKGLWHPLLAGGDTKTSIAVPYNIQFPMGNNFLVLTGANMSGKTTFLRALGVSTLLAHIGMGVPAKALKLSFFHGIITNMHVEDNLLKGESYFYAEVLRMKQTALKMRPDLPQLVLLDELFKGTNVHDAYECTKAVMEGLIGHKKHLIVLSTHLYEVAGLFLNNNQLLFCHFETNIGSNNSYRFSYQLKDGISEDRIGYQILQREGVMELLLKK